MTNNASVPAQAFGYSMPPEFTDSTEDVIHALNIKIEAPVLFQHIYNMLTSNGKDRNVTPYDVFSFLLTCKKLNLNPMLKQIYGFVSKGKVVNIISIDGWNEIANRYHRFDGFDFEFAPAEDRELTYTKASYSGGFKNTTSITVKRKVSDWVKCKIYRKDRNHPISVITYYDEASTNTEPWATMPMQMLQNRAFANAVKKAFNVNAYSEDDQFFDYQPSIPEQVSDDSAPQDIPVVNSDPIPDNVPVLDNPVQSDKGEAPQSILSQVYGKEVLSEPALPPLPEAVTEPKKKRTKRKEEPKVVTAEEVPVEETPAQTEPVQDNSSAEITPDEIVALSETAAKVSGMLFDAKSRTQLQFYGQTIAGMKDLSEKDKSTLRKIYQQQLKLFKE